MLLSILVATANASNDAELINQIHQIFAGLALIIMYGTMFLSGLLAAFQFGTYNGPAGYNPFI